MKQIRFALRLRTTLALCCLLLLAGCPSPLDPVDDESGGNGGGNTVSGAAQTPPTVILPAGYAGPGHVTVTRSKVQVPATLEGSLTPIGPVWEVSVDGHAHTDFGSTTATLSFGYDAAQLAADGFIEEFVVYVRSDGFSSWERVVETNTEVRSGEHFLVAQTSHFSSFVVAAAAAAPGGIQDLPQMDAIFPNGIGGSAGARFTLIDENFAYYLDRTYYVQPVAESAVNAATFAALGLDGSVGISTYNGGGAGGPQTDHKLYAGTDYIVFDAHMNLDVYLLYDTRGGADEFDTSRDAPWIQSLGFQDTIDTAVYFLETTDPAGLYRVYKRSYAQGETVRLHGNHHDDNPADAITVDTAAVQTNYWVIIKPEGDTSSDSSETVTTGIGRPQNVVSADVIDGVTTTASPTFTWQAPADGDGRYQYSTDGGTTWSAIMTAQSATVGPLIGGPVYTFVVRAYNAADNVSAPSSPIPFIYADGAAAITITGPTSPSFSMDPAGFALEIGDGQTTQTVSAVPGPGVTIDSYSWRVNGVERGNGQTIMLDTANPWFVLGANSLTLVVEIDGVPHSDDFTFTVNQSANGGAAVLISSPTSPAFAMTPNSFTLQRGGGQTTQTVTVAPQAGIAIDSYAWRVNGVERGTDPTIVLDTADSWFALGVNNLTLIIHIDGVPYSDDFTFTVEDF